MDSYYFKKKSGMQQVCSHSELTDTLQTVFKWQYNCIQVMFRQFFPSVSYKA